MKSAITCAYVLEVSVEELLGEFDLVEIEEETKDWSLLHYGKLMAYKNLAKSCGIELDGRLLERVDAVRKRMAPFLHEG